MGDGGGGEEREVDLPATSRAFLRFCIALRRAVQGQGFRGRGFKGQGFGSEQMLLCSASVLCYSHPWCCVYRCCVYMMLCVHDVVCTVASLLRSHLLSLPRVAPRPASSCQSLEAYFDHY